VPNAWESSLAASTHFPPDGFPESPLPVDQMTDHAAGRRSSQNRTSVRQGFETTPV
jgi:hypothetical protein